MVQGIFSFTLPNSTSNPPYKQFIINTAGSFTFYTNASFTETSSSPFYIVTQNQDITNYSIVTYYFEYTTILSNDGLTAWTNYIGDQNVTIITFGLKFGLPGVPLAKNGLNFRDYSGKFPIDPLDIPTLLPGTNIESMFFNTRNFNQNIDSWNVSSFTNFSIMFNSATSFNQSLPSWDVSNATQMNSMFNGATAFNGNISTWNIGKVTTLNGMFNGATNFNQDITNWNTSNVTDMSSAFNNAKAFNYSLGNWNIKKVGGGGMSSMLNNSGLSYENYTDTLIAWASKPVGDIPFNTVLGAFGMGYFKSAESARNTLINTYKWVIQGDILITFPLIPIRTTFSYTIPNSQTVFPFIINTASTVTPSFIFYTDSTYQNIASSQYYVQTPNPDPLLPNYKIITYYVQYQIIRGNDGVTAWPSNTFNQNIIIYTFGGIPMARNGLNFRQFTGKFPIDPTDIPTLLPGTNINGMFYQATNFNQDITLWDVSSFTDFGTMFEQATSFNQNISNWNVSNATSMNGMFRGATSFNQPIGNWSVSKVTDFSSMFSGASKFNQDLSNWNISNATNLTAMFKNASVFNGDISTWNTSKVTNLTETFQNATAFNKDISNWNTSNVTNFQSVLQNANSFNYPVGKWNIKSTNQLAFAFNNTALSVKNYSNLLISFATQAQVNNKSGINMGVLGLYYNKSAILPRRYLKKDKSWIINGDKPYECVSIPPGTSNFHIGCCCSSDGSRFFYFKLLSQTQIQILYSKDNCNYFYSSIVSLPSISPSNYLNEGWFVIGDYYCNKIIISIKTNSSTVVSCFTINVVYDIDNDPSFSLNSDYISSGDMVNGAITSDGQRIALKKSSSVNILLSIDGGLTYTSSKAISNTNPTPLVFKQYTNILYFTDNTTTYKWDTTSLDNDIVIVPSSEIPYPLGYSTICSKQINENQVSNKGRTTSIYNSLYYSQNYCVSWFKVTKILNLSSGANYSPCLNCNCFVLYNTIGPLPS